MTAPWAVTPEKIDAAVKRLVEVARPSRIILFGSVARGEADDESDVDLHRQHAAEKAVKAVLPERNVDFPYTHDLEKLVGEVTTRGLAVPSDVARAEALTDYAVKTRYPNREHEITEENVADAIRIAEATVAWASSLVRDPSDA